MIGGLLEQTQRVLVGNVDCEFEAERVDEFGEVGVEFEYFLIIFHLIINEIGLNH
jgi:hypothetical protein